MNSPVNLTMPEAADEAIIGHGGLSRIVPPQPGAGTIRYDLPLEVHERVEAGFPAVVVGRQEVPLPVHAIVGDDRAPLHVRPFNSASNPTRSCGSTGLTMW